MEKTLEFICSQEISEAEKNAYIARGREKFGRALEAVEVELDGEFANVNYHTAKVPFDRIRRITGYLVGTMDKWNNGKLAEEKDRVKHAV